MKINFIDKRYRVYNKTLDITVYTKDIDSIKNIAVKNCHQLTIYVEKFMNNRWRTLKFNYNENGTKNKQKVARPVSYSHIYRVSQQFDG